MWSTLSTLMFLMTVNPLQWQSRHLMVIGFGEKFAGTPRARGCDLSGGGVFSLDSSATALEMLREDCEAEYPMAGWIDGESMRIVGSSGSGWTQWFASDFVRVGAGVIVPESSLWFKLFSSFGGSMRPSGLGVCSIWAILYAFEGRLLCWCHNWEREKRERVEIIYKGHRHFDEILIRHLMVFK